MCACHASNQAAPRENKMGSGTLVLTTVPTDNVEDNSEIQHTVILLSTELISKPTALHNLTTILSCLVP